MSDISSAFENIEAREATQVAALDIGSNSFHLVVARILADSVQILHRVKQKVRLADGLGKDTVLSEEAIQRGLETLTAIAESIKGFEPDSVRIVATYTLRKAKNAKDFIRAAKKIMPYPIEIISGIEEARLIYSGVAHTSQDEGQRLVVDIGGGSTEFIIGEGFETKIMRSLQMGCVSYTKRFFADGSLKQKSFSKAILSAQQELELIDSKYTKLGWQECIGTSGTIKAIMLFAQNAEPEGQNGCVTLDNLMELKQRCCKAGHIDQLAVDNITPDRIPVLAAGLSILIAVFRSLDITSMEYSAAALREGVIYEMEEQLAQQDIRERTAQSLATRYDVDIEQARRVHKTAMQLFDSCKKAWNISGKENKSMLGWSALLHEVGLQINSRGVQKHSAYILANVDLHGFNQEQQALLSILTRFQRKKIRQEEFPDFWQYEPLLVRKLVVLLRIAVLLNIKRQDDLLPEIQVQVSEDMISLQFPEEWLAQKPIISADLERESESLANIDFTLTFA